MGNKKKDRKNVKRKDVAEAIDEVNSFGVDVVYRSKDGDFFGKKATLNSLFPRTERQRLEDIRDDIDKQLADLDKKGE